MGKKRRERGRVKVLEKGNVPKGQRPERDRQQDERNEGGSGRTAFFLILGSCF